MKGQFITIEGIEGVGKTTAVKVIVDYLYQHLQGIDVVATREPGGTMFCEQIRSLFTKEHHEVIHVDTEILLLFASRNQHIQQLILPALERGAWVICDRFIDATYAYQVASGVSESRIQEIESWVTHMPKPDLTFLLDAPVSLCIKRLMGRKKKDRIESREEQYFSKVKENYLKRYQADPSRFCVINAEDTLEDIHAAIEARLATVMSDVSAAA
jgi:dTMP kinase